MSDLTYIKKQFVGDLQTKEYYLKISSKDSGTKNPFCFDVKFNMSIQTGTNTFKKEAIINSKFNKIRKMEISDIVVPRFIPTNLIGQAFDGVNLIKKGAKGYIILCYPGVLLKNIVLTKDENSAIVIKLQNQREVIYLCDGDQYDFALSQLGSGTKIITHININNFVHPITLISNNGFELESFSKPLPESMKLICGNYYTNLFLVENKNNIIIGNNTLKIMDVPELVAENVYQNNIIQIVDTGAQYFDTTGGYYFQITSYSIEKYTNEYIGYSGSHLIFSGNWINKPTQLNNTSIKMNLFGFGIRDLLDERIFFLEIEQFAPRKATTSNDQLDKMFGILFPSTQSKEWLYLSGEPKEEFIQRDYRKLDKMSFKIYDSKGELLGQIYDKRLGLLNENYYSNIYTNIVIKVDEIDEVLNDKK